MSEQQPEIGSIHYGPCVHCGHLRDEHGEREACLRAGFYGNRYGCCEVEHGDGPEWTAEEHVAYARASMGEPVTRPGESQ